MQRFDDSAETNGTGQASAAATLDDVAEILRGIQEILTAGHAELIDATAGAALLGVSRATWDRMRSAGLLPAPVKLYNGSITRWRRAELMQWIADCCPASK